MCIRDRVSSAVRAAARAGAEVQLRTPLVLISEPRAGRDRRASETEAAAGADASASREAAPELMVVAHPGATDGVWGVTSASSRCRWAKRLPARSGRSG
eukprot:9952847-Alexandrium_andersonii.AAC.1